MSITLLSLDMIFERFIVMRSFGALECRQFQHHYEGAFEGNRARNSLRCRWWHRAFARGHLLKISSAWVYHCCLWTWFLKGLSWWDLSAPLNADSFSIIMKGLSKEIELGTHCDVADDIALLLGVTFLRSVQHEYNTAVSGHDFWKVYRDEIFRRPWMQTVSASLWRGFRRK
jgi:hypothetical protein